MISCPVVPDTPNTRLKLPSQFVIHTTFDFRCSKQLVQPRLQVPKCDKKADAGFGQFFAGLYLSALALHMAGPAQRYTPEPLNYAVRVLESVCSDAQGAIMQSPNRPPFTSAVDWLKLNSSAQSAKADSAASQPLSMVEVLTRAPEDGYFGSRGFQCSAITAAVELVSRAADLYADLAAMPEILAPAQRALTHLAVFSELPKVGPSSACVVLTVKRVLLTS